MSQIDTLILTGGGMRDVSIIGALNILKEKNIIINKYAGSSSGAMICTLLNIGYTPDEIEDTVFSQGTSVVYDNFFKIPFNLLFNYGLFTGNKMVKYLNSLFEKKGYSKDITFIELFNETQKTLVITGTSLTQKNTFYFNYHTFPNMKVIDAVRISISIPLYFTCVKYTIDDIQHIFCDGGLLNNFPLHYFEVFDESGKYIKSHKKILQYPEIFNPDKIIGITIVNPSDVINSNILINNISDYITSIINTISNKIQLDNSGNKNLIHRVISINLPYNVNPINFNLSKQLRNELIVVGNTSAKLFFEQEILDNNFKKSSYLNWF